MTVYSESGNDYHKATLKEVKAGEFFRLSPSDTANTYRKQAGDYDRSAGAYFCELYEGRGADYIKRKGSAVVWVGFTY